MSDSHPTGDADEHESAPLSFLDAEEEKRYWHSRTPAERLREVERLRRIEYGERTLGRMERVLDVTRLPWL